MVVHCTVVEDVVAVGTACYTVDKVLGERAQNVVVHGKEVGEG